MAKQVAVQKIGGHAPGLSQSGDGAEHNTDELHIELFDNAVVQVRVPLADGTFHRFIVTPDDPPNFHQQVPPQMRGQLQQAVQQWRTPARLAVWEAEQEAASELL